MKKLFLTLLAALMIAPAVVAQTTSKTYFEGDRITGVSASSMFEVTLVRSDRTRAVVEVASILESHVRVSRDGAGIVSVSLNEMNSREYREFNRLRESEKAMKLTLYLPSVNTIRMSGATTLRTADNFNGQDLDIMISGVAAIRGRMEISSTRAKVQASGATNIENLVLGQTTDLIVLLSGTARAEIAAPRADNSKLGVSGATNLEISGAGARGDWNVGGTARLRAEAFTVKELKLVVSGAANAGASVVAGRSDLSVSVGGTARATIAARGVGASKLEASGASNIRITGDGQSGAWSTGGTARISGDEFSQRDLVAETSGASSIQADVSGSLTTSTSGTSSIRYRGNPSLIHNSNSSVRPL